MPQSTHGDANVADWAPFRNVSRFSDRVEGNSKHLDSRPREGVRPIPRRAVPCALARWRTCSGYREGTRSREVSSIWLRIASVGPAAAHSPMRGAGRWRPFASTRARPGDRSLWADGHVAMKTPWASSNPRLSRVAALDARRPPRRLFRLPHRTQAAYAARSSFSGSHDDAW